MAKKFRNRYRKSSLRAPWWNYGNNGSYFVTICTKNMAHFFGEIHEGIMYKSDIGLIAHTLWAEIPYRFPYAHLGAFIVMPNHFHGIINIDKTNIVAQRGDYIGRKYF